MKISLGRNVAVKGSSEISNPSKEAIVIPWTEVQASGKEAFHEDLFPIQ